ncbi:IS3 family transposase [Nocardioides ultimimeridianus]
MRKFKISERRACKVVGQHRSSNRYKPVPTDFEQQLVAAMKKHADRHPRFGYRRVHALLVADGWDVNVKRVERLWRREELRVPPPRWEQPSLAIAFLRGGRTYPRHRSHLAAWASSSGNGGRCEAMAPSQRC